MSPWFGRGSGRRDQARRAAQAARSAAAAADIGAKNAARTEALITAATELVVSMTTPLGRRFVTFVHEPWPTRRPATGTPRAEILDAALRRLGESPQLHVLRAYESADRACREHACQELAPLHTSAPTPAANDIPAWLMSYHLAAFDETGIRLDGISREMTALGGLGLPWQGVMHSSRWWPGGERGSDPLGYFSESRSEKGGREEGHPMYDLWEAAWEISSYATGIPTFDPYEWVLTAFRNAPIDAGGLGLPSVRGNQ